VGRSFGTVGVGILTLLMVASFQNCSGKFKSSRAVLESSSAQCKAVLKAEVSAQKLPAAELRCGDFNSFACERRVFSPDVEDLSHSLKECMPGDQICVDVDVRQFNTSGARSPASESEFTEGGAYNREDVRCYHRLRVKGLAVLDGEGDSIEAALAQAMHSCEAAVGEL